MVSEGLTESVTFEIGYSVTSQQVVILRESGGSSTPRPRHNQSSSLRTQGPIRRAVDVPDGAKGPVEPACHHNNRPGLWVPAFAGTTARDIQSAWFADTASRSRGFVRHPKSR